MQSGTRRAHDLRKCFELLRLLQSLGERLHRLGLCELRGRGLGQPHFPVGLSRTPGSEALATRVLYSLCTVDVYM